MKNIDSYKIDKLLQPILEKMHKTGVKINIDYLNDLNQKLGLKLLKLESEIYNAIGHKFNINSPSQLAKILYKEIKIEPQDMGIKRKKMHHSTSAKDLAKISHLHPAIKKILKYRELYKLKTTYLEPLPKLVDKNSRVHTTYAIDTITGRLSSKNPNLQNIPIRTEVGREIRKAFVAEKGYKLVVADYSQIELRIAAHFSGDPVMIEAFKFGRDIHKSTAEELGVDRRTAKTVNFGILYGVSAYGLSDSLNISQEEAQALIDKYFLAFPKLSEYIKKTVAEAEKNGYVQTLFGRRREIPELNSSIERIRKLGERIAVNTPFQGTAAEIIKLAMLALSEKLKKENVKLILQVHDELVFEIQESQIKQTTEIIRDVMENIVKLKVPLVVDIKIGRNWGELE